MPSQISADTRPEVEAEYRRRIMERSGSERVQMTCSMFDTAKQIILAAILNREPHIPPARLREEIFLRFYGNDFTPERRRLIVDFLECHSANLPHCNSNAGNVANW